MQFVKFNLIRFIILALSILLAGCSSSGENGSNNVGEGPAVNQPVVFAFAPFDDAYPGTLVISSTAIIEGFEGNLSVSIVGGEYSIDNTEFSSINGVIESGQTIALRLSASESFGVEKTAVLTIGDLSVSFNVITVAQDTTPEPFIFDNISNAAADTQLESNAAVISGINSPADISVSGGEYSIDGGEYSSVATTIISGQSIRVRTTSSGVPGELVELVLSVGGISGTFTVTTALSSPAVELNLSVTVEPITNNSNNGNDQASKFNWLFRGQGLVSGQFANGDHWVASSEGGGVELVSLTSNQIVRVDDNRTLDSQGFFGGDYGNYDATKDILKALDENPRFYTQNTVLVAATERNQLLTSNCGTSSLIANGCIDAYHFVTILDAVPPGNGVDYLRPPTTGTDKTIQALSDFDLSRLPSLTYITGTTTEGLAEQAKKFRHGTNVFSVSKTPGAGTFSEGGRAFRCGHILCDEYSAGFSQEFYDALSYVFSSDHTFIEKKELIAVLLTLGRDMYGMMHQGGCNAEGETHPVGCVYSSGGGQNLGNFITAAFYSAMLVDSSKASVLSGLSSLLDGSQCDIGPQELDQINGHLDKPLWGGCERFPTQKLNIVSYWTDMVEANCYDGAVGACNLVVGQRATRDPYGKVDGSEPRPGGSYIHIVLGQQRSMVAAACVIPELAQVINYPPLYSYVDRINTSGIATSPDNCAPPSGISDPLACSDEIWAKRNQNVETWDDSSTACPGFGVTWGPDTSDLSKCIAGAGRFNDISTDISASYPSRLDTHFDLMRGALGTNCGHL